MSTSRGHELLPSEEWVSQGVEGFILLDPVSGQPLDPFSPPEFLADDTFLSMGKQYLDALPALSPDTRMHFMFTDDEVNDRSIGDDDYFEDLLLDPRHGVQAVGHTVDGVVRAGTKERLLSPIRQNEYTERIAVAANSGKAAEFCVGLEVDIDGNPAGDTEYTLQKIRDLARLQPHDLTDRGAQKLAMDVISRSLDQWYRVLKTGERIMEIRDMLSQKNLSLHNAIMLVPIADADMRRKVETQFGDSELGDNNDESRSAIETTYDIMDEAKYTSDVEDEALFMASGVIMYESLK